MSISQSISVTTDAVLFTLKKSEIYVLLIQRKNSPFKNHWALPGGFVEDNERVKTACQRELKEETGLPIPISTFVFIDYFDNPKRDPRGRTLSFVFGVILEKPLRVKGSDDANKAEWINLKKISNLAFDHFEIIQKAKHKLLDHKI